MREVERLKGELAKEVETHKLKLRKQEILFAKEIEAASNFIALHHAIQPTYSHPDKDWDEALEEVVHDFSSTEDRLRKFEKNFGPVLKKPVREALHRCISTASNYKFADHPENSGDMNDAKKAAEELLESLGKIEALIVDDIRS